MSPASLTVVRQARTGVREIRPALKERPAEAGSQALAAADELAATMKMDDFFENLPHVAELTSHLCTAYKALYVGRHRQRFDAFSQAICEVKGRPEWLQVTEEMRSTILLPLSSRLCGGVQRGDADEDMPSTESLPADETRCIVCHATLSQMESDLAALPSLRGQVIARMQEVTAPEEHLVRVRAADFFTVALNAPDVVDEAVELLSAELHKRVAEGATVIVE